MVLIFSRSNQIEMGIEMSDDKKSEKNEEPSSTVKAIGGIIAFAIFWFGYDILIDHEVNTTMKDIELQVATDAVAEYKIAKQQGDAMQTCVQAGMVSAAWLQANNQGKYNKWKKIEKNDCKKAGMPEF